MISPRPKKKFKNVGGNVQKSKEKKEQEKEREAIGTDVIMRNVSRTQRSMHGCTKVDAWVHKVD